MNLFLIIVLLFLALIILNVVITNSDKYNKENDYYDIQGKCSQTHFGCCPDGVNSKMNIFGSNCPGYKPPPPNPDPSPKPIGGCAGTIFGCCPNGKTSKMNQAGTNCSPY
jgi:hypothetical protein